MLTRKEIAEQDAYLLRRYEDFRRVAEFCVRAVVPNLPWIRRVSLFGSLALPPFKEVPRFNEYRHERIAVWHEVGDIDLAVWADDLAQMNQLRVSLSRALNELIQCGENGGVASHHFDVFLLEPGSDRYLGRLCHFASCPKPGKLECLTPGCGAASFVKVVPDFRFDAASIAPERSVVLCNRPPRPVV